MILPQLFPSRLNIQPCTLTFVESSHQQLITQQEPLEHHFWEFNKSEDEVHCRASWQMRILICADSKQSWPLSSTRLTGGFILGAQKFFAQACNMVVSKVKQKVNIRVWTAEWNCKCKSSLEVGKDWPGYDDGVIKLINLSFASFLGVDALFVESEILGAGINRNCHWSFCDQSLHQSSFSANNFYILALH